MRRQKRNTPMTIPAICPTVKSVSEVKETYNPIGDYCPINELCVCMHVCVCLSVCVCVCLHVCMRMCVCVYLQQVMAATLLLSLLHSVIESVKVQLNIVTPFSVATPVQARSEMMGA